MREIGNTQAPADLVLQFAKVVTTSRGRTSATLYNIEAPAGDKGTGMDVYGQLGLVVRPPPPDQLLGQDRHAEMLCVRTVDGLVPIAGRDVRLNQFFPNPKPGDVALVGYGSNFVKLGIDGRISVVATKDGTPNGAMMQIQLRPDGFAVLGDWGKLSLDEGGMHVLTHTGARFDMGGVGGLPAPLDSLGRYISLAASIAKIEAPVITLGPRTGLPEPASKSTSLQVVLDAVGAAMVAEAAALTALGAIPTNSSASAAIGTAVTALNAAAVAITAGKLTIPSQSTLVT